MKVLITSLAPGGLTGHPRYVYRIVEVPEGEPLPEGARQVPDETPLTAPHAFEEFPEANDAIANS